MAEKRKVLEGDFKVAEVKAEWCRGQYRELLVGWDGYNFMGDTWEREENVQPRSKVQKYRNRIPLDIDLKWAIDEFRRCVKDRMTSAKIKERGPAHRARLPMPALNHPDMGRAMVRWAAGLGGRKLKVSDERPGELSVESWDLDFLAELVLLHGHKMDVGLGNLRIKCGRASHEDMMMLWHIKLYGGRDFRAEITMVIFDGKSGDPTFPKILEENPDRITTQEENVIVDHAKMVLRQTWSIYPIEHDLRTKGWVNLPFGTNKLKQARANPSQ